MYIMIFAGLALLLFIVRWAQSSRSSRRVAA